MTKPFTGSLSFKADLLLHDIEQSMNAIDVLMRELAGRGDPDKTLISPVYAILESTDHYVRDLRKLIEGTKSGSLRAPGAETVGAPSDVIKRGVHDLDGLIGECHTCFTTLCKLTDFVETEALKATMFWVTTDLDTTVIKMRRIHNELHVAVGGRAS